MRKAKGFGSPQNTRPFTLAILESPAPGVYTVAVACKHGSFVVTASPQGVMLTNTQLGQIPPAALRWLAKNRDAIGHRLYASEVQA